MLRSDSGNSGEGSLSNKSSPSSAAASRRRQLVLTRHNHFLTNNPRSNKSCSSSGRGEEQPKPTTSSISHPSEKMNPYATTTSSSSSSTPFRRLDGDINREAGLPLTGQDIVSKDNKARGVNCSAHGSISVIGRRREVEDRLTVAPSDFPATHDFFGVYDGHGGARVSSACRDHLHRLVGEMIERWNGGCDLDWESVMKECFKKMDEQVLNAEGGGGSSGLGVQLGVGAELGRPRKVRTDGSMALVVVLSKDEIVVANCGDSRAVLYRNGMVIPLSLDQKPDMPDDERRRIESGGWRMIDRFSSLIESEVPKMDPGGDREDLKSPPCMISKPEVTVTKCSELDNFLIMASNGLWDVVSNEDACEVVKKCLEGHTRRRFRRETTKNPAIAAAMLAELAMAKGSKDNVSVIVVEFKNKTPASRP